MKTDTGQPTEGAGGDQAFCKPPAQEKMGKFNWCHTRRSWEECNFSEDARNGSAVVELPGLSFPPCRSRVRDLSGRLRAHGLAFPTLGMATAAQLTLGAPVAMLSLAIFRALPSFTQIKITIFDFSVTHAAVARDRSPGPVPSSAILPHLR